MMDGFIFCLSAPVSNKLSLRFPLGRPLGLPARLTVQQPSISEHRRPAYVTQHHQQHVADHQARLQQKQRAYCSVWPGYVLGTDKVQREFAGRSSKMTLFVPPRGYRFNCRFFSGGAAKPGWVVSKQHQFGPTIPDNAYYGEHATYSYFVLFIRGLRPYLEKLLGDCWRTLRGAVCFICRPLASLTLQHNPEFRLQLAAVMSFLTTHAVMTGYFNETYQRLVDISSLLELQKAQRYATEGFWLSPSEQQEHRLQQYAEHHRDLGHMWREALREATLVRSFDALVRFLKTAEREQQEVPRLSSQTTVHYENNKLDRSVRMSGIPPSLLWSFTALPYGKDDPHTKTFPIPDHEQPLRAFALSFTSNNLSGNWGDYLDRQDNKNALMRPARMMFTDALIPSTK